MKQEKVIILVYSYTKISKNKPFLLQSDKKNYNWR
jgi:hypothetical protein